MKEAKAFGEVVEVASSAEATYTYIPKDYTVPADADYFHVTTNNTIYGTELHEDLDSPVPMIADMSSDISLVLLTFLNIFVSMAVRRRIWLQPVLLSLL